MSTVTTCDHCKAIHTNDLTFNTVTINIQGTGENNVTIIDADLCKGACTKDFVGNIADYLHKHIDMEVRKL